MKNPMISRFIFAFGFFFSAFSHAQFQFEFSGDVPVKLAGETIKNAWGGGFNYVQISDIDFDFDGDLDLFFFDRSMNNIRVLEQIDIAGVKSYKTVYNAKQYFPTDLTYRVALLDYNLDGKKDIFTYGIGGVKVYKNTGDALNGISWELTSELLISDYNGTFSNLYVSSADIPAYVDVDNDGDIDVLTFNLGGDRLEYHQNQSQELYNHSDSLIFILKNECWGKFSEDAVTSEIHLNAQYSPCTTGNIPDPQRMAGENVSILSEIQNTTRHAGSTILALDIDNSGVLDLLIGDVNLTNLILLINGGTEVNSNSTMVSFDENFPSNTTPINISIFPAAFFVDADFDGVKDLLVCPNAKNTSHNFKSISFYKNLGTNALPNFSFSSSNYFQSEMIDVGTGSMPIFVDLNNNGVEDLFIANFFSYKEALQKESVISYYSNFGTNSSPSLNFIESDFLNLSTLSLGLKTVPTFGDVDGDGDRDMFLGIENGSVIYFENTTTIGGSLSFGTPIYNYQDNLGNLISAQNYAFPQLFDLNGDNLLDLIIGKKTGEILYYENIGNTNNPSFELKNDMLGNIDVSPSSPLGYAAPHFFKFEDTIRLLLGSEDGKLRFYDNIENNLSTGQNFSLISANYLDIDVEQYSACWVNDVDSDGNLDLFVGGVLGGFFHFENNPNSTLSNSKLTKKDNFVSIFPNPTNSKLFLNWRTDSNSDTEILLVDSFGKTIFKSNEKITEINLENVANGIYFLKINDGSSKTFKLLKN
jgi:hypothetical protein